MKDNELTSKISNAFEHAAPDVFDDIMAKIEGSGALKLEPKADYTFTSKISEVKSERISAKKKSPWIVRSFLIALAAAAAIFIPVGISSYNAINSIASVVSIDVNPSIEINVNKNRKVISVVPLNDDAKSIVGDMDFKGTDLNVAINALLGSMISKGYLSEIANSILISVDNANPEEAEELRALLMSEVEKILSSDTFNGAIIGQTIKDDAKLKELASKYGITLSKAQLIDEIISQNPKLNFEDLVKLTINDLNLLKKKDADGITSIGNASDSGYVGLDAATLTALENAGLDKSKVSGLTADMDYDDGKLVYEVDFSADGKKYEYEIDAVTGKILKGELEKNEQAQPQSQAQPQANAAEAVTDYSTVAGTSAAAAPAQTQPAPTQAQVQQQQQPSLIGYDRAKSAALSHAGVGSVYDYEAELDYDGTAHYEIEFKSGGTEYSYDIDAYSGAVLWYEWDTDDDYQAPAQQQAVPAAQTQAPPAAAQAPVAKSQAPADIGAGQAKNIAFSHAGVGAGSVRELKLDSENEDGRIIYEIEFKAGNKEYSYEIDGSNGGILDYEIDEDD